MRTHLARWLVRALVEHDKAGEAHTPGSLAHVVLPEPDGSTLAAISQGATLDLYFAGSKTAVAFSCSPRTALRLALWIVVRWWALATWCGLKSRLWWWAVRVGMDAQARARGKHR